MGRLFAILLLSTTAAFADGGAIQLHREVPPFILTIFTTPTPLHTGPTDITVLVQDLTTLQPVLDASVSLGITGRQLTATRGQAQNKLLYAATANLSPGQCDYSVTVRRGTDQATVHSTLMVSPASSGLAEHWLSLALVPFAIFVFALHQRLKRRQSARSAIAGSTFVARRAGM